MIKLFRYTGKDQAFIMLDGRNLDVSRFRREDTLHPLCLIYDTQGLSITDTSEKADFKMEFYSRDGHPAPAPGEALLCAIAFADFLGIKPFHTKEYSFEENGRILSATIDSHSGDCKSITVFPDCLKGEALFEGETLFEGEI